ncbi:MAG: T9SS type A sorting domain-containing protein [Chitinophagaceae bacterium]
MVDKEIFVISPSWQDVNISIINAVGQLVEPIITTENPNKLILNVSNLASGAYILIFNNGVNVQSNKFVIMH